MSSMSHAALAQRPAPYARFSTSDVLPVPMRVRSYARNEALRFLRGAVRLTDYGLVVLHQLLVDPVLVARITSAYRSGARLGANVSISVSGLQQLLNDPLFDWGNGVRPPSVK